MVPLIIVLIVAIIVLAVFARTVRIVPQARARVVERLGRYHRTLTPGLALVVPFIDRLRPLIDLREQVVSFPPQPVITEDNLVVNIDSVIYFQVTDAKAASYEIQNYIQAIEQLTVTTLRNVIGGMALEKTLTSRDEINSQLRGVLDEATGKWGIRVNRVELKAIDPPASIKDTMEKQMRADREKRAAILQAEGRSRRRSSPPKARSRPPCCARRASAKRRSSRRRARRRRSAPSSRRSMPATPTRSSSRISTCRRCRRSRRARRTRSGSSRPSSSARSGRSAGARTRTRASSARANRCGAS